MKKKDTLIIILLSIIILGLSSYIIYGKFINKKEIEKTDLDIKDENSNLIEEDFEIYYGIDNNTPFSGDINKIDFKKMFQEAEYLYAGFGIRMVTLGNETIKVNGNDYNLVSEEPFNNRLNLNKKLNQYFSYSIVRNVLNKAFIGKDSFYKEINGKVYRLGGTAGQFDWDDRENNLEVEIIDNDTVVIHNKIIFQRDLVENKKEIRYYDYNLIRDNKGNFQFINFELPTSLYGF